MSNLRLQFVIQAVDNATRRIRDVNREVDKAREPMRRLQAASKSFLVEAGLGRIAGSATMAREQMAGIAGTVGGVVRTLGAASLAGAGLFAVFKRTADAVDEIADSAAMLGTSTQRLQELQYAATLNGASAEEMSQALRFLSQNMVEARNGSKEMQLAFARGGVSLKDLQNSAFGPIDAFYRMSDTFKRVGDVGQNASKKIALSQQLMNRGGAKLIQLLNQGSPALRQFALEANRVGFVLSDEAVQGLTRFNDEFDRAKLTLFGNLAAAFSRIAPRMTELVQRFTELVVANREVIASGIERFFDRLMQALPSIARGAGQLFGALSSLLGTIDDLVQAIGGWGVVVNLVAGLIGASLAVKVAGLVTTIAGAVPTIIQFGKYLRLALMGASFTPLGIAIGAIAAGALLIVANWEKVKETFDAVGQAFGRAMRWADSKLPNWMRLSGDNGQAANTSITQRTAVASAVPAAGARTEVGGELKIKIDAEGRARVAEVRKAPGGQLDFGVYSGAAMVPQ